MFGSHQILDVLDFYGECRSVLCRLDEEGSIQNIRQDHVLSVLSLMTARVGRNELRELRRMSYRLIGGLRRCAPNPPYIN